MPSRSLPAEGLVLKKKEITLGLYKQRNKKGKVGDKTKNEDKKRDGSRVGRSEGRKH